MPPKEYRRLSDIQIADFIHTEISDSEISDAPVYDYNAHTGRKILSDGIRSEKGCYLFRGA